MLANVKLSLLTPAGELARKRTHPVTQKDIARLVSDRNNFFFSYNPCIRKSTHPIWPAITVTHTNIERRQIEFTEIHAYLFTLSSRFYLQPKNVLHRLTKNLSSLYLRTSRQWFRCNTRAHNRRNELLCFPEYQATYLKGTALTVLFDTQVLTLAYLHSTCTYPASY
jgi:hypothetical protein